jgi:hypothetical protein
LDYHQGGVDEGALEELTLEHSNEVVNAEVLPVARLAEKDVGRCESRGEGVRVKARAVI